MGAPELRPSHGRGHIITKLPHAAVCGWESPLAVPESYNVAEAMGAVAPAAQSRRARRLSPLACAAAILVADVFAIGLATIIVMGGVDLLTGHAAVADIASRGSGFHDVAILFVATVVYLAINGRYNEHIPFWAERADCLASFWVVLAGILVASLNHTCAAIFRDSRLDAVPDRRDGRQCDRQTFSSAVGRLAAACCAGR